jgi:hypothetical protein
MLSADRANVISRVSTVLLVARKPDWILPVEAGFRYFAGYANSAERNLTAVMAVPPPGLWEKSAASIGSNGSTPSGDFSEIEATIHRLCDARR